MFATRKKREWKNKQEKCRAHTHSAYPAYLPLSPQSHHMCVYALYVMEFTCFFFGCFAVLGEGVCDSFRPHSFRSCLYVHIGAGRRERKFIAFAPMFSRRSSSRRDVYAILWLPENYIFFLLFGFVYAAVHPVCAITSSRTAFVCCQPWLPTRTTHIFSSL